MKIVVTGRHGQIVQSLLERAQHRSDLQVVALGRPELDLARPETVYNSLTATKPDLIVSAAAYTAVDQAEDEPEIAFTVNAIGARAVAHAAKTCNVPLIHLSTDYVYGGDAKTEYLETDSTSPLSIYGQSKLEGEHLIADVYSKHIILRTAWVYSAYGNNFVKKMLNLANTRDNISVVCDQWGNPTMALDIADAIFHVADHLSVTPNFYDFGIYNLAGTGTTNWSDFARRIFYESAQLGGSTASVTDIPTANYPTKAVRPLNSKLSVQKFEETFGFKMPYYEQSLKSLLKIMIKPEGINNA